MIAWQVQEAEVKLFRSFLPQLCKRTANHDFAAIVKFMPKDFFIEEKMDGERIQLHKRGNEYFYCSRLILYETLHFGPSLIVAISLYTGKLRTTRTCMELTLAKAL